MKKEIIMSMKTEELTQEEMDHLFQLIHGFKHDISELNYLVSEITVKETVK